MKPRVTFEAMSIVRNELDARLVSFQIEFEEWVELIESLGWSDDALLEEIDKRWFQDVS